MKLQSLLVYRPGASGPPRANPALQFKECAKVRPIVEVGAEHVPFIQVSIPERRLSPVVVANLLPHFPRLAAKSEVPVFRVATQPNVLDRIPEVGAQILIAKKAPVFV